MTQVAPEPTKFGHFAGPVTRAVAYLVDVVLSALVFAVAVAVGVFLLDVVTRIDVQADDVPTWLSVMALRALAPPVLRWRLGGVRQDGGDGTRRDQGRRARRHEARAVARRCCVRRHWSCPCSRSGSA